MDREVMVNKCPSWGDGRLFSCERPAREAGWRSSRALCLGGGAAIVAQVEGPQGRRERRRDPLHVWRECFFCYGLVCQLQCVRHLGCKFSAKI
jgi:hypothetical protein